MEWWNLTDIPVSTYRQLSRIKHSDSIFIDQTNLFTKKTIICFIHLNILECFSIVSTWRFFVYALTKTFHYWAERQKNCRRATSADLWSGVRFFCDRGNVRQKNKNQYKASRWLPEDRYFSRFPVSYKIIFFNICFKWFFEISCPYKGYVLRWCNLQ